MSNTEIPTQRTLVRGEPINNNYSNQVKNNVNSKKTSEFIAYSASMTHSGESANNTSWYGQIPIVGYYCFVAIITPFNLMIKFVDLAISLVFLGIIAFIYFWYTGLISDDAIISYVRPIGQRLMTIFKNSAL